MTELSTVRTALVAIRNLDGSRADEASVLAQDALTALDRLLERQRQSPSRLLVGVDESCITRCELIPGGAVGLRARLGSVVVQELYIGDEETMSDETILANGRLAVLDSLRVEIVRERVLEASDRDLLDALDAAERGGDDEVGEIRVAAHERGLRWL